LTKQEPVEPALKCHLDIEEADKIECGNLGKMLEKNAFVIRDVEIVPRRTPKRKVVIAAKASSKVNRLGKITKKLYDLEPTHEPEKPLKIDLNLYQMENF